MLSGFCLYYPLVKKSQLPGYSLDFQSYLLRRFTRIAPPYYFAAALCLAFSAIPAVQVGRWQEVVGYAEWSVIFSHLVFVHNLIPSHATKIDYPMWSIGLEFQLYLVFPFLIWAFRRTKGVYVAGAALLVAAAIRASYRHLPPELGAALRDGPFSYLEIFCAGMIAAALTVERRTVAPRWLLALGVVGGLGLVRLGSGNGLVHDLETTVAAFCLLLLATKPDSAVSRVLSTPWLAWIGFFSYSLYLIHAPLLHVGWLALRPLGLSDDAGFALLVLVGVPLIVLTSYGFHLAFERPFMRLGRRPRVVVAEPAE
jgi:peptidoglycan/LPS O-acetylase OafA/YrhL